MSASAHLDWTQRRALAKTALFFVLVPGTVAGYVPYQILRPLHFPTIPDWSAWNWAGTVLILTGMAGLLWCGWYFATEGRGTPAPIDAPKVLVVSGPYRWVRNPMYVCVAMLLLGEAAFFRSAALGQYLLLFVALVTLFVMLYEEPALRARFGEPYMQYCRRVWRWIPRPPHG